jgi:hypothetical protein
MSSIIEELLGRLMTDDAFRSEVMAAPDEALAHYNLVPAERTALEQLNLSSWSNTPAMYEDVTRPRRTL